MSTAVSCWEWIMGARQDLELQVSPSSCLYHLWGGGYPHPPSPLGPFKGLNCHTWEIHPQSENYVYNFSTQVNLSLMGTLECVASVSVWFRSKERPRNGIFGFWPREKWTPPPRAVLLAPFFALSLTLVPRSLLRNARKCLLWTHKYHLNINLFLSSDFE